MHRHATRIAAATLVGLTVVECTTGRQLLPAGVSPLAIAGAVFSTAFVIAEVYVAMASIGKRRRVPGQTSAFLDFPSA